jgi:hypothetical protein
MRRTVLTLVSAALIAAASVQVAAAGERNHVRRAPQAMSQQVRNANAAVLPDSPILYSGGWSAPAGR